MVSLSLPPQPLTHPSDESGRARDLSQAPLQVRSELELDPKSPSLSQPTAILDPGPIRSRRWDSTVTGSGSTLSRATCPGLLRKRTDTTFLNPWTSPQPQATDGRETASPLSLLPPLKLAGCLEVLKADCPRPFQASRSLRETFTRWQDSTTRS